MKIRTRSTPGVALKLAFRLPVYVYSWRLGWLFGHRLLLLTHRGRKSGREYRTALEVIRYDPTERESVVVSAWGERADWYRNLRKSPAVEIESGRERYVPTQRFLGPEEVYAEIAAYERNHPWLARLIPRLLGHRLDGTQAARRAFAASLRMVAFRPGSS